MSTLLYRLGRSAFRRRKTVAALWLALLVLMGVAAATLAEETTDSFDVPGTESVDALAMLQERFPEAANDGATARVVFAVDEGEALTDPEHQATLAATLQELAQVRDVVAVTDPFEAQTVAPDLRIAYAEVAFNNSFPAANEELTEAVEPARDAGMTVELAGEALMEEFENHAAELIGLGVAAIVLVITFGSFVAAGLPLLNAIIGIGITIAALTAATRFFDLSSSSPTLALMLGLALAIDYSLFIVSRYRHERRVLADSGDQDPGPEAMGRALGTAGSAVVFAGLTVMIALLGLSVVGLDMLTEMGLAAAFAVAMAVLIALTMLPALCGMVGRRITGGQVPGLRARDPEAQEADGNPSLGTRYVKFITRRPLPVLLLVGVGMVALAIPAADLRLGLPDDGQMGEDTTQRQAYDLIAEGFGAGANGPLMVVVDTLGSPDPEPAAQRVFQTVSELDNVVFAQPPVFNQAGDTALVTVIPQTGPSSEATEELVEAIRGGTTAIEQEAGVAVAVTGQTAIIIDFNEQMGQALLPYLSVVVGLSLLLMLLVFRSILVPIKAALGFLLTMGATFGAVVAVFQWGWLTDLLPVTQSDLVVSFLPIILIGVVFGLAMDYQVFMVTRMREEYVHGAAPKAAVVTGFQHGSRVVAAAAIIMISVFAGFTLSGMDFILQIALALAIAIALDAFVVRMTLVPALLALLGRAAWWLPRWLDKILPNVDIEGEKLRHELSEREAEPVGTR
ncbi:MMPL family transporter [Natronosporangium hydrolyticum]|uniref:MMPL family transporter n=1 Tax=Natronosporangium hydrolyticum TaxID=2811111 RepID=A0A895YT57_9ACTN|nr:MMPL family transporter [Natronosporangium hydrolyticum]